MIDKLISRKILTYLLWKIWHWFIFIESWKPWKVLLMAKHFSVRLFFPWKDVEPKQTKKSHAYFVYYCFLFWVLSLGLWDCRHGFLKEIFKGKWNCLKLVNIIGFQLKSKYHFAYVLYYFVKKSRGFIWLNRFIMAITPASKPKIVKKRTKKFTRHQVNEFVTCFHVTWESKTT